MIGQSGKVMEHNGMKTTFKRFVNWCRWSGWSKKHCTCGQQKICAVWIRVVPDSNGVIEQDSAMLLKCGEVKRQMRNIQNG